MGGREPTVSDEEIVDILKSHEYPLLTTAEIAEELPIKPGGALPRLHDLADEGRILRKNTGERHPIVWGDPDRIEY